MSFAGRCCVLLVLGRCCCLLLIGCRLVLWVVVVIRLFVACLLLCVNWLLLPFVCSL